MELKYAATILVILAALSTHAAAETDCETHPEPVNPHTCCPVPELISEEIKEKCMDFFVPPLPPAKNDRQSEETDESEHRPHPHPHPRPHPHPPHHKCLMSCVFNETGILNEEQKLDEENLSEYLAAILQDENEEWIPALEASFKTCIVRVEEMAAKWQAKKAERLAANPNAKLHHMPYPGCPMKAGFLAGCVFMETFQNCPSSYWNDSQECNDFKDFVQDCKPQHAQWRKRMHNHGPTEVNNV